MLMKPTGTAAKGRRYSLTDQAKALAVILREEFGVAFVLYDVAGGAVVWFQDFEEFGDQAVELEPSLVTEVANEGRAQVRALPDGRYQLVLPLYESGETVLVAAAALTGLAPAEPHVAQEHARLEKWAQAVCDRLRGADQLRSFR